MEKNIIKELMTKYQLNPMVVYNNIDKKLKRHYFFDNSPYSLECLMDDDMYKQLNCTLEQLAEMLFSECQIQYSQENEFFID